MTARKLFEKWRVALLGLLVIGVGLAGAAPAQAGWTNPYLVNPAVGEPEGTAMTPDGDAFVVYGTSEAIVVQELPAGGYLQATPPVTVSDGGSLGNAPISMGASDDGRVVVAWEAGGVIQVGGLTPEGQAEPVHTLDTGEATVGAPQVAVSPGGDAAIIYSSQVESDPPTLERVMLPAGGEPGPAAQLNEDALNADSPYLIAADGQGGFRAFWGEDLDDTGVVTGKALQADGTAGEPITVSSGDTTAYVGAIGVNDAGQTGVCFFNEEAVASFRLVEADGTVGEGKTLPSGGIGFGNPGVSLDADGDAIVTWIAIGVGGIGPKSSIIPKDGPAGELVPLNPAGVSVFNYVLAGTEDGRFTIGLYLGLEDGFGVGVREGSLEGDLTDVKILTPPGASAYTKIGTDRAENGDAVVFWGDGGGFASRSSAELKAEPTAVDFGSAATGGEVYRQVKVTNDGGSPLDIGAATVTGTDADQFAVELAGCSDLTLGQGASCGVIVRFAPTSTGAKAAQLELQSDGVRSSSPISLSGDGTPPPDQAGRIRIAKVAPARSALRRGKSRVIRVRVANNGAGRARAVWVCSNPGKAAKRRVNVRQCVNLGNVAAGGAKVAKFRVKARRGRKAIGRAAIPFRVTSAESGNARRRAVVIVRR